MIAYVKGKITVKTPSYLVVEASGVGYQVFVSLNTYSKLQEKDEALVHTIYHVTENAHTLYGFADEAERELFTHLISVSGVGPATARLALSYIEPAELRKAILHENLPALQKIKGIGAKSAKRIILELKDKLLKPGESAEILSGGGGNTSRDEALSALVALGFNKATAEKAIAKVLKDGEDRSVEQLIKLSLKSL